jgi:esterase/lipase superfamily enzyme
MLGVRAHRHGIKGVVMTITRLIGIITLTTLVYGCVGAPGSPRPPESVRAPAPATAPESAPTPRSVPAPTKSARAPAAAPAEIPGHDKPDYAVVRVFFATDRNLTGSKKADEMFGVGRSTLRYGICDVSIPRDHRMGELESPSIWKLEFREDPAKHLVLLSVLVQPKDKYFTDLAARVRASAQASTFLFVHGYNVTFEDASRRTAQISYDLGFDGAPVFYSWPSQGTRLGYTVDEQNIEWAQANLKGFLEDFFGRSDAQSVYLIAHSMGNRALTRAVASLLAEKPSLGQRLKEVILTAPDIDADVFKRDIAPALTKSGRPITLYASSEDLALVASKKVHGYPRAGDSGQGLVVVPGIETIDATGTDTSLLGHSYFAETRSVLSDIFYLVRNGQRAEQRFGLQRVDTQAGKYWVFKR